ncbi:MAG: tetratricopeptide repeat protein [Candidatus Wallbacteria bacterium]|nr:tetratricopeptide repeat protein [Candidatus Wallbacteria bacterium]
MIALLLACSGGSFGFASAEPSDAVVERARKLIAAGEPARAVPLLLEAKKTAAAGLEPGVLLALGRAYAAQKERTYALEAFDAILKRHAAAPEAAAAQYEKALMELTGLPSVDDVLEAMRGFATFNPLSLDPDAIHHLFGVEKGYRLERIGPATEQLGQTWSKHPESPLAAAALLRQVVLEGFLTSQRKAALQHLELLFRRHPRAAEVAAGRLFEGFLLLLEGQHPDAARAFASVHVSSGLHLYAAFFSGLAKAYLLGDMAAGRPHFESLAAGPDAFWSSLGSYHLALAAFADGPDTRAARTRLEAVRTPATAAEAPGAARMQTWKNALLRTLDRVDQASGDSERRLVVARFWRDAGHRRRAISELEALLKQDRAGPEAPEARLELGRLLQEDEGAGATAGSNALLEAAATHPEPERALEARWRAREGGTPEPRGVRPAPGLEALARDGRVWQSRAVAELARRAGTSPVERGRLLKRLEESVASGNFSAEETRRRLRDVGDFLAAEGRHRPAMEIYRKLLPEEPSLQDRMISLAALNAMGELEHLASADRSDTATGSTAGSGVVSQAIAVSEALLAAGERQSAIDLLERAATRPGGLPARVRRLTLELAEGPLTLASLGKVNALLEEKGLAEVDRFALLEWKARVLEHEQVEKAKALDLYRYLVEHGWNVDALSALLAERSLAAGKAREALTSLAKSARGPRRDLLEARALAALKQEDASRERFSQLVVRYPESAEAEQALALASELDVRTIERAASNLGGKRGSSERELTALLARLIPGEASRLVPALDALSDALVSGSGRVDATLVDALIATYEGLVAPSGRLGDLYRLRMSSGRVTAGDTLALARAMVRAGRAREGHDALEGKGPEAALEQALILHEELKDPARAVERLKRLMKEKSAPTQVRGRAAAQLASWRRGQSDEREALEASVAAQPRSTAAADALERLATLAAAKGDQAGAAQRLEAAAMALPAGRRAWSLALDASRVWLEAAKPEEAARIARGLLAASDDFPEQARRLLARAAGRQQATALESTIDRDDPANPANVERLLAKAEVQTRMLNAPDEAATTLLELEELFPESSSGPRVSALRQAIALGRAIARQERRGGEGLVVAGILREGEGGDPRGAALDYSRAVDELDGKGPLALLARLYLARICALWMGDTTRAARALDAAAAQPEAARFRARLQTARACLELPGIAARLAADPMTVARAAAGPLQDPALLQAAVEKAGPGRESFQLTLQSAASIDPLRAVTPLGPDVAGRLELAARLAGERAADALLALADWRRERGEPEEALQTYVRAEMAAPADSQAARTAAARRGMLLEGELADSGAAAAAYRAASMGGRGPFQELAAARLPLVLARRESDEAEAAVRAEPPAKRPQAYLEAARKQAKLQGQLDRAAENYRVFLRVATDAKLLDAAHRELAEVLVRADLPREAAETLARLLDRRLSVSRPIAVLLRMAEILEQHVADLPEAARFYEEVQRLAPDGEEAKAAADGLKRLSEASKARDRAEQTGASESKPSEELATIKKKFLTGTKDPEGAVEALQAQLAIASDPMEKAALYTELARVQAGELKDFAAADAAYEQAVGLQGKSDEAALLTLEWATLLSEKLKQPKRAMQLYDDWMTRFYAHPKKVAVMLERARLMEAALDNAQGAIDVYRNIANAYPRSGFDEQALLRIAYLSRTYFANHQGAVDAFDQIARRFPFGPNAQTALFQAAQISEIELGDLNRAVVFYNRLVATYPTSPLANDARNALARIERRRR